MKRKALDVDFNTRDLIRLQEFVLQNEHELRELLESAGKLQKNIKQEVPMEEKEKDTEKEKEKEICCGIQIYQRESPTTFAGFVFYQNSLFISSPGSECIFQYSFHQRLGNQLSTTAENKFLIPRPDFMPSYSSHIPGSLAIDSETENIFIGGYCNSRIQICKGPDVGKNGNNLPYLRNLDISFAKEQFDIPKHFEKWEDQKFESDKTLYCKQIVTSGNYLIYHTKHRISIHKFRKELHKAPKISLVKHIWGQTHHIFNSISVLNNNIYACCNNGIFIYDLQGNQKGSILTVYEKQKQTQDPGTATKKKKNCIPILKPQNVQNVQSICGNLKERLYVGIGNEIQTWKLTRDPENPHKKVFEISHVWNCKSQILQVELYIGKIYVLTHKHISVYPECMC
jgi:hypothetical protein